MLEGQLEVGIIKGEAEQTIFVYQNSHSTLTTPLGYRMDEHTCMGQSMRPEVLNLKITDHLALLLNTMYHVQCVTLQHGELL